MRVPARKVCVILGAGASNDAPRASLPPPEPSFPPPLVEDLFNVAKNPQYYEVMRRYSGAQDRAQDLAKPGIDLEEELRRLRFNEDARVQQQFKFIPPYIRDLVDQASRYYQDVSTGYVVDPNRVTRDFQGIVRKAGLPHMTFKGLRHAHATLLLVAGVHPKVVSERLGHSNISTTMDIYSHVIPGLQEKAAQAIDESLGFATGAG